SEVLASHQVVLDQIEDLDEIVQTGQEFIYPQDGTDLAIMAAGASVGTVFRSGVKLYRKIAGNKLKLVEEGVEDASRVVDDVADASGNSKLKGNGLGDNGSFEAEGDFGALNQPGMVDVPGTIISPEMENKILYGQRATNSQGDLTNRLTGAHSGNISNEKDGFAIETLSVNSDGTRNVKLITQYDDGNVSKIKNSTLFPANWSDDAVISAVTKTGSGEPLAIRASDGASLYQATIDGVKVEVIKVGDNVTAGYPCGRGCTDPLAFGGN
ncbi:MAG: EndoU domain-containing protein, partial [Reinekea sp.]